MAKKTNTEEQPTAVVETKTETKPTRCMVPSCEREVKTRGLCSSCYQAALKHIKAGKTTWKALEDAGKCLPASGRSASGKSAWFLSDL